MATDYNGQLNFIVEHVGLPRIEDFCFMATQEPNVYAGLSVVVGGLMHARPKFFAKVMGELLFWVGEDKMLFGSDYAIWEPKWQIEGLLNWEMPDDPAYADFPRLDENGKRKILGLNARQAVRRRGPGGAARRRPGRGAGHRGKRSGRRMNLRSRVLEQLGTVYDPELDEPITTLGFVGSCVVTDAGDVSVRLRLPTPQCAPNFAFLMAADARAAVDRVPGLGQVEIELEDHYTGDGDQRRGRRGARVLGRVPGRDAGRAGRAAGAVPAQGAGRPPGAAAGLGRRSGAGAARATCPGPTRERCRELRAELGYDASDDAPAFVTGDGAPVADFARFRRMASLTALSLETNGGMCRDLLRVRYSEEGVAA